jgi:DGQHR domain-containing protein
MSEINGLEEEEELAVTESDATPGATISYTASLVRQGKHRFYTLTMPSQVLAENCTVDTRIEDPIKGFQRRLDLRRARDIANYIDKGFGTIPGSIILSAQPTAELAYHRPNRTVSFKKHPRAFLILDGQHRVYGFHYSKSKLRVPVSIYNNLSKADEVRLFRDINTNQRPVPNELLLDINRLAETETTEQALLHDVFDLFDRETDSPLFGLMSSSEKREGKISRVTFNASIRAIFSALGDADAQQVYEVLRNYLHAWHGGLRARDFAEPTITNPTLFRAIMLLFPFIAGRVFDRYQGKYTVANFEEALSPLLSKLKKSDIQRAGATHLDMHNLFRKRLESGFSIASTRL